MPFAANANRASRSQIPTLTLTLTLTHRCTHGSNRAQNVSRQGARACESEWRNSDCGEVCSERYAYACASTRIRSLIHSFIHSLITTPANTLIHTAYTHSREHPYTHAACDQHSSERARLMEAAKQVAEASRQLVDSAKV